MRSTVILLFLQLWGNVEVSSQIACPTPPDVPHAHISEDTKKAEYQGGHVIHFTCDPGYTTSGPTIKHVCTSEGWLAVQQETCYPLSCAPPPADGGLTVSGLSENGKPMLPGHILMFSCDVPGKFLNGSVVLTCGHDGQWDHPFPSCGEIRCAVPEIADGYVQGGIQEYKEHEVLHYNCNPSYKRSDTRPSKCTKLGIRAEWIPTPMCGLITCKLSLPPLEGTRYEPVNRNVFLPGNTVRVICGEKYWISNHQDTSAVITCKEDGQWSVSPVCQATSGCQSPPPLTDGDIKHTMKSEYSHGERVEYLCQTYHTMEGQPYRTCNNGEWIGQIRCLKPCVVDREAMSTHNIAFKFSHDKLYSTHDDVIAFRCTRWRSPVSTVSMRQRCVDGVMQLPTCQ